MLDLKLRNRYILDINLIFAASLIIRARRELLRREGGKVEMAMVGEGEILRLGGARTKKKRLCGV